MSESLEKLHNRILSDGRLKASNILSEAETKAKQVLDDTRVQARKEADEVLSKATLEADSIRRSILSSRIRTNRLRVLEVRNKIVQDVVKSVEERLSDLPRSEQFQSTLKRFVAEAIEAVATEDTIVRVGFQKSEAKGLESIGRSLPKGTKFVIEPKPIDELGGVVASDPEGKMVFNNSFKARLQRLDNQLLTTISSTIFGE